ncbi:Serine acetyltransferase [Novipirellula aureliae]|uniref:Serine acetyltransferase n=1 Tax=Novipirellula aureliae TaxID=2527966 RepID=A0A5C6DXB6_9BACT|nr:serine acetyltransferase [Novipirellula aureliae]TWU41298.1 Serine acetyltransferase [Novipirellula aureliae]
MITADARAIGVESYLGMAKAYWVNPGFRAVLLFRVASGLAKRGIPFLPGWIRSHTVSSTGADLSPQAIIDSGLVLPHPVGVVIGSGAMLGKNVFLFSGVVIGQRETGAWPTLEDGVNVYAGAKVLGKVRVGKDAKVGANAVVINDVDPHTTVVGIPAEKVNAESEKSHSKKRLHQ